MQIWNESILERMREFEQNMSTVRYFLGKGREIHYIFGAILYIWWDFHDKDQGLVLYFHMWDIFIAKRGNDIIVLGAIFYVGRLAKWHSLTLADSLTATKDRNQVLHKMQISQWLVKTSKNKVTTRWEGPQSLSYHKKDKSVTSLHPDLTPVCMSPIAQQHNHINKPHAQLYPTKLLNSNQINSITHHNHSITNHKRMYAVTHFTEALVGAIRILCLVFKPTSTTGQHHIFPCQPD